MSSNEYSFRDLNKTIIPNYGDYLYDLLNGTDVYDFYVNLCVELYINNFNRDVNYRSKTDKKLDKEAILNDTDIFYGYNDVMPLLFLLDIRKDFDSNILDLNKQYLDAVINQNANDAKIKKEEYTTFLLNKFNANYIKIIPDDIPKELKSWPTIFGPLLWIWIHISFSFTSNWIDYNLKALIVKYLGYMIKCGECHYHYEQNKNFISEYITRDLYTEQQNNSLLLHFIRLHNQIRIVDKNGNKKSWSINILPFTIKTTNGIVLNKREPTNFEIAILGTYKILAAKILKCLQQKQR